MILKTPPHFALWMCMDEPKTLSTQMAFSWSVSNFVKLTTRSCLAPKTTQMFFPDESCRPSQAVSCFPHMKSSFFSPPPPLFKPCRDVPRILPFRHIHLPLCLVSHRLFILAFISAITAVPIWSLRAKWKPVVSLRCGLKVSACNGSWHPPNPHPAELHFYSTASCCRILTTS